MSTVMTSLNVGDRVGHTPFGEGAKLMLGTITNVNHESDGDTYDVIWDFLDWETQGWRFDEDDLVEKGNV